MYVPIPSALSRVLWTPVLLGAVLLWVLNAPVAWAEERASAAAARNAPGEVAAYEDELLPLTEAQQAAKQLAATLENERASTAATPVGPAAIPLTAPDFHEQRFMIKLYASDNVEVRVISGRQTFASPVDMQAVDEADARRPMLLHAEDGAIAIDVLLE